MENGGVVQSDRAKEKEDREVREEESEQLDESDTPLSPKKIKAEDSELDQEKAEQVIYEMPGIPIIPADMGQVTWGYFYFRKGLSRN